MINAEYPEVRYVISAASQLVAAETDSVLDLVGTANC